MSFTVHVTGGSGFLGGHVIPHLVRHGHTVTALARSEESCRRVAELGATPILGNLDDPESILAAFRESNASSLANLASLGFGHAPTIVNAAVSAGLSKAVFISTTGIFTTLAPPSKEVRKAAERCIQESTLDWTIVRPTMIYGTPADRNMARLLKLLQRTPFVPLPGGGRRLQQPVHVDDLAMAVVSALEQPASSRQIYDVAGPEPVSLREVVREAARAVGRRPIIIRAPLAPTLWAARVYERFASAPRIKAEQVERLAEDKAFSIQKAEQELGYSPRSFAEGIQSEAALL